jgi:hypothetical protein
MADRPASPLRPAGDEVSPPPPPGDVRVGRRLVAVVAVVALIAVSGWQLTQVGVRASAAPVAGPPSGAWFCPHGGGQGRQAWIVVANPGAAASHVRVTSFDGSGSSAGGTFTVPPSHQVFHSVPAGSTEAATQVEFFGGWVAVSAVVQTKAGAIATERCVSAPQRTWLIPDASTGPEETAYLVVMNPFDVNAEFDVQFRTEDRLIRPGPLTPDVLRPGRSIAIRVNAFALAGPRESTVTAEVRPIMGRVVAGGVGIQGDALRAEAGTPEAGPRLYLPATGYAGIGRVYVANVGSQDAVPAILQAGSADARSVSGTAGAAMPRDRAATFEESGFDGASTVVSAKGAVLSAGLRLESSGTDQATVGAAAPAASWVVPAALPPSGGTQQLALFNPGRRAVHVTVRLFGDSGPASGDTAVTVPPGRTVTLEMTGTFGTEPLSASVTAGDGTIVVGTVSSTPDGHGFGATTGVPASEQNGGS